MKYKIVLFDEIYTLFHFNIILKHNGMSSTKISLILKQKLVTLLGNIHKVVQELIVC